MTSGQARRSGAQYADPIASFYIPATSQALESLATPLKQGESFALLDPHGDIPRAEDPGVLGVYYKDTRHLSGLDLLVEGERPLLLSSSIKDDNAFVAVDLANPDFYRDGKLAMSRETLHVVRSKFLWNGTFNERVLVQNFGLAEASVRFLVWFEADFRDLFEVRGIRRERRGTLKKPERDGERVCFRYLGLDGLERVTALRFSPRPTALADDHAVFDVRLAPHAAERFWIRADFGQSTGIADKSFGSRLRAAMRQGRNIARQTAAIETSNEVLNEILCRGASDLHMLTTETAYGPFPYAGIPWFSTAFGRDGIITALQMLWLDPGMARGVLCYLAARQATADDPLRDAEPGKILHETRQGEMARTGEVPFGQYYGSVDATPLFVLLAGRYFRCSSDIETIRKIWPNILAALSWIDGPGDRDRDGFVEYSRRAKSGLGNQGWKDSNDSIMHADGSLAEGPIALCEVQAYVYEGKREAAGLAAALGHHDVAQRLEAEAATLREKIEQAFWCEEIGTYAIALDGDKRPCRVRSSNAGHVLFASAASQDRARRVASVLMHADSFSGWGIRTLARGEARYNPMSYHNGSVWPHDNAMLASGLARYGLKDAALSVFRGLFDCVHYLEDMRLPELFCGFSRRRGHAPTRYPVACSPQAWASASLFGILASLLGIDIDGANRLIRFRNAALPEEVEDVVLRGLAVGTGKTDLRISRHRSTIGVDMLSRDSDVSVIVES